MRSLRHTFLYTGLLLSGWALVSCSGNPDKSTEKSKLLLPVLGERKLGQHPEQGDTIYHTVGNFTLTNQYGQAIDQNTTNGKIYVADFFFATCQSICPQMSTQLERVQATYKDDPNFLILSHTVNPTHDTVPVLYEYAGRYGALQNKWHFLTGSKRSIYALAKDSYLLNALEEDGTPEGFLHSELLMLVDKHKRVRGMYDGTDSVAVNQLIQDIALLKQEELSSAAIEHLKLDNAQ